MKQLNIEQLEILGTSLNKKMIIINQQEQVIFAITIVSNMKVVVIKIKIYQ